MDSSGIPLHEGSRFDGSNRYKFGSNHVYEQGMIRSKLIGLLRRVITDYQEYYSATTLATLERIAEQVVFVSSREFITDQHIVDAVAHAMRVAPNLIHDDLTALGWEPEYETAPIPLLPQKEPEPIDIPLVDPGPAPEVELTLNEKVHVVVQSEAFDSTVNVLSVASVPLSPLASGIIKGSGMLLRMLYPSYQDITYQSITGGLMSNIIPLASKPQVQSVTIWGLVITIIGFALKMFGLPELSVEDLAVLQNSIAPIMEVAGLIMAYIGRLKSKTVVEGVVKQKQAA